MKISDHSSVTSIFLTLKSFFLNDVGLTLVQTISLYDLLFQHSSGMYLRFRKMVSEDTVHLCIDLTSDLDAILSQEADHQACYPFITTEGGSVSLGTEIYEDMQRININMVGDFPKRYRGDFDVVEGKKVITHQNHLAPSKEPNFIITGGEYIKCGA